jgi:hypothetical protein
LRERKRETQQAGSSSGSFAWIDKIFSALSFVWVGRGWGTCKLRGRDVENGELSAYRFEQAARDETSVPLSTAWKIGKPGTVNKSMSIR